MLYYQVVASTMKKNDLGKGVGNDRGTILKVVFREDFFEEAIFAQKPEWVGELVTWIQGKSGPTEGLTELMTQAFFWRI